MPRPATGNAVKHGDNWFARVAIAPKRRKAVLLPMCHDEESAQARARLLAEVVGELRKAKKADMIPQVLEKLPKLEGAKLNAFVKVIRGYASGAEIKATGTDGDRTTFQTLAERWTNGELAREFPGMLRQKRTAKDDEYRLNKWVYPVLGPLPLSMITLDEYERLLRSLPPTGLSAASRRQIAQLVRRVLQLAVYPARMLRSNPIPPGALPRKGPAKARAYLFPAEEQALMECDKVPLAYRILYGFLAREGMRTGEAAALCWKHVDLERGTIRIEVDNKTDDYRMRSLDRGVTAALSVWKSRVKKSTPNDPIFPSPDGSTRVRVDHLADQVRQHLETAGIKRHELFHGTERRLRLRAHDLRATFVTLALAAGKSETWIADRTGHHSSAQIANYRRDARTVQELGFKGLAPLNQAIPELRAKGSRSKGSGSAPTRGAAKRPRRGPNIPRKTRFTARRDAETAFRFRRRKAWRFKSSLVHQAEIKRECVQSAQGPRECTTDSATHSASSSPIPRPDALAQLARAIESAAANGDTEVVRVLARGLQEILVQFARPAGDVIDLATARRNRPHGT